MMCPTKSFLTRLSSSIFHHTPQELTTRSSKIFTRLMIILGPPQGFFVVSGVRYTHPSYNFRTSLLQLNAFTQMFSACCASSLTYSYTFFFLLFFWVPQSAFEAVGQVYSLFPCAEFTRSVLCAGIERLSYYLSVVGR